MIITSIQLHDQNNKKQLGFPIESLGLFWLLVDLMHSLQEMTSW